MPVYFPERDPEAIAAALAARPEGRLVACLCAAWCGTCTEYLATLSRLAERYPQDCFVWIDVETHADALGDLDIENFPTVLVQPIAEDAPHFYGVMLPHLDVLERMLARGAAMRTADPAAPDLLGWLRAG
jgi:thioredoxin-like negative regulator of GroEL